MNTQVGGRNLSVPFVLGDSYPPRPQTGLPLSRFLPPYHAGMAARRAAELVPAGNWILDPFGQDPFSVLELARAGYRVLVTANNPVPAFIMEVLASGVRPEEWSDALLALANLKNERGQRFEDELLSYYRFPCPKDDCPNGSVEVSSFIWYEDTPQPVKALGSCALCGNSGEFVLTPELLARMERLPSYALYKAQTLEMLAKPDDPLRQVVEEVLRFHTPRALILLHMTLAKLDLPVFVPRQRILLQALLLTAMDQCNQLWAWPLGKNRPRQLVRPPTYQETNLWHALVRSKEQWQAFAGQVPLTTWPDQPPLKGGISLFRGRLRELTPKPEPDLVKLVRTSLPRRNQAYWNLSGVWAGLLWGRNAVLPMRNSLLSQRYDWTWHSTALAKVLGQLKGLTRSTTPVLLQIGELDPMFLSASILAAQEAGLYLSSHALDGENTILQTSWQFDIPAVPTQSPKRLISAVRENGRAYLAARGEPCEYSTLFTNAFLTLLHEGGLQGQPRLQPNGTLNELHEDFATAFTDRKSFVRYEPGLSVETGRYGLPDVNSYGISLSDRVEKAIVSLLQGGKALSLREIAMGAHQVCKGELTPDPMLVLAVTPSYADDVGEEPGQLWQLRPGEHHEVREKDLRDYHDLLVRLGRALAYTPRPNGDALDWLDEHGTPSYTFFLRSTACISDLARWPADRSTTRIIALPGSRANLVSYKLKSDPVLQQWVSRDWHLVKFRQLRNLNENPLMNRELFVSLVFQDPPEFQDAQLALF